MYIKVTDEKHSAYGKTYEVASSRKHGDICFYDGLNDIEGIYPAGYNPTFNPKAIEVIDDPEIF